MTPVRIAATASALFLALSCAMPAIATAQGPGKDDALDKLLQKLDEPKADKDKDAAAPKPGAVKAEDKDLDRLLQKLGEGTDAPETKADRPQPGMPGAKPPEPKPEVGPDDKKKDGDLKEEDQELDDHLAELLGRKKKPKDGQGGEGQPQQGEGGGEGQDKDDSPLGEAIRKMEEVRQKLDQADTGEGTRKTEGEVVAQLEEILEKLRQAQGQGQQQTKERQKGVQQAGTKPGQKPGPPQPTPDPQEGVGPQAPARPTLGQVLAGGKDTWGDLPPALRQELENVFKEDMLPSRRDMIIRYYSSVSKKGRANPE
jgi:hypothetical protein